MNNNTLHLIKEYITSTLKDASGISLQSHDIIKNLMQENRDLALDLHNLVEQVECIDARCYLKNWKIEIEYDADHGHEL